MSQRSESSEAQQMIKHFPGLKIDKHPKSKKKNSFHFDYYFWKWYWRSFQNISRRSMRNKMMSKNGENIPPSSDLMWKKIIKYLLTFGFKCLKKIWSNLLTIQHLHIIIAVFSLYIEDHDAEERVCRHRTENSGLGAWGFYLKINLLLICLPNFKHLYKYFD